MAAKLKDSFDGRVVRRIARDVARAWAAFDARAFERDALRGLEPLELMARGWHVADALHRHLPPSYPEAARVLVASLGPEAGAEGQERDGTTSFRFLPHGFLVARYGQDHLEASLDALEEITKRFTSEFAIRPFLEGHPEATFARLEVWARSPNVHVRRLVSEGTRPRLPWAPRLRALQNDPSRVLALLERLRDDPERYVQRSVANALADVAKDHPERAIAVCRAWSEDPSAPPSRRWIVKHALRWLVKQGHPGALASMGHAAKPRVRLEGARVTPAKVKRGGEVRFVADLVSTGARAQDLLVDYAVHYAKQRGTTSRKVFKHRRVTLAAGDSARVSGRIVLVDLSTRKHHPGHHAVELLVNGVAMPIGTFELLAR